MAVDKPLHLFSDTTALRIGHFTNQTNYTAIVASSGGGLTFTPSSSAQTHSFANGAQVSALAYKRSAITQSTAASTALSARGVIELGTSSTTAAGNWILTPPSAVGEELMLVVKLNGSTFGVTVNASTATAVTFGAVAATTDQIRMTLTGALGSAAQLIALSTSRWLVTSSVNATFSTAAA